MSNHMQSARSPAPAGLTPGALSNLWFAPQNPWLISSVTSIFCWSFLLTPAEFNACIAQHVFKDTDKGFSRQTMVRRTTARERVCELHVVTFEFGTVGMDTRKMDGMVVTLHKEQHIQPFMTTLAS